jgi:hypothetical protein
MRQFGGGGRIPCPLDGGSEQGLLGGDPIPEEAGKEWTDLVGKGAPVGVANRLEQGFDVGPKIRRDFDRLAPGLQEIGADLLPNIAKCHPQALPRRFRLGFRPKPLSELLPRMRPMPVEA